jgi:4,5-DOPA dioxygenase extradiol
LSQKRHSVIQFFAELCQKSDNSMKRKTVVTALALSPLAGIAMKLNTLRQFGKTLGPTPLMPALFIGHGSPTNALENNEFSSNWRIIAKRLPKPQAILCISAHWETIGSFVTSMPKPKTIHDFEGFSQALFDVAYPSRGNPELAQSIQELAPTANIHPDLNWGLDHGCWVPLLHMYPEANIPVLQLSLDSTKNAAFHYQLGKELAALRKKGVLIMGSGNMVHNFRYAQIQGGFENFNKEFGHDWALEMNRTFKQKIQSFDHKAMIDYESLGAAAKLAIPTTEHYFPLLYILGLQGKQESLSFFNDKAIGGSFTMTSVLIGKTI